MLKPLLVIGVGGSGGKTIRAMKDSLDRKLRLAGWTNGLPSAWQFLQVDTVYDGQEFPAKMLPQSEVCVVVNQGDTFEDILKNLESFGNTKLDKIELLAGWGIDSFNGNVSRGAGMIRGIGRQVGIAEAKKIETSLRTAISKMQSNGTAELNQIAQRMGFDPQTQVSSDPEAMLITSLSGGSGAGMFMDVAEILKRTETKSWAQNLSSFLYTAEVFEALTAAGDVRQNCLGAMNEIVAGRYQPVTDRTELLFKRLQISENIDGNNLFSGSKVNFLIGSRNSSGIDISQDERGAGQNEVFMTIGETLAGVVSDPEVAEFLYNQATVNVAASSKIKDSSGLSLGAANVVQPFMSIGFGRLTLGIDRVSKYVADALTRAQITKLLFPEDEGRNSERTPDELLKDKVNELERGFIANSGLNEFGTSANDVTDKLIATNLENVTAQFVNEVLDPLTSSTKPVGLNVIAARTWAAWEAAEQECLDTIFLQIRVQANDWVNGIQNSFTDYISEYIASDGLKVSRDLISALIVELNKVTSSDLPKEIAGVRKRINLVNQAWWSDKVIEVAGGRQGLSSSDSEARESLASKLRSYAKYREEDYRKDLTISLLRDFQENYLLGLRGLLDQEFELLLRATRSSKPEENDGLLFSKFPDWRDPVPAQYKPRSIEQTLIDPSDFKKFFEDNAAADLTLGSKGDVFAVSSMKALLGLPLRSVLDTQQKLLSLSTSWQPQVSLIKGGVSSRASFSLSTRLSKLREDNESWLEDENSAFGMVQRMSIRKYCIDESNKVLSSDRQRDFVEKYHKMLLLAAPLVTYNRAAIQKSLRNPKGQAPLDATLKKTKKVPFGPGDEIYGAVKNVLQSIGVDTSNASFDQDWFDDGSVARELYTVAVPEGPMPAYAFASLTSPIAKSVLAASTTASLWASYSAMRRTRPLPEAIPATGGMLKSIITGWIVANIFGLVKEVPDSSVGLSLKIWNPTLEGASDYSMFPSPLLEASAADNRLQFHLPSVLTSMGLAMVNFGETGDIKHMYSYRLLKFLGREISTFNNVTDEWDNNARGDLMPNNTIGKCDFLAEWISTGDESKFTPEGHYSGPDSSGTPEMRIQRLIDYLNSSEAALRTLWETIETQPWSNVPSNWELKDHIFDCLRNIKAYVEHQKLPAAFSSGIGF